MLITRWQASLLPNKEQIEMVLSAEGLASHQEMHPAKTKVGEHKHPFDEIRVIISGEMLLNISGNKLKLRNGDRIEIPSNTKHSFWIGNDEPCISMVANRPYRIF